MPTQTARNRDACNLRQPVGTFSTYYGFSRSFEEYRYVVTKFDQACDELPEFGPALYGELQQLVGATIKVIK